MPGLLEKKGITPAQAIDYQALIGDTSDNVPGVEGIGPKTASKLLEKFGDLDGVIAGVPTLKGKQKERLEAAIANGQLALSKQLVTLMRDVETGFDAGDAVVSIDAIDDAALNAMFERCGFNGHPRELARLKRTADNPEASLGQGEEAGPEGRSSGRRPLCRPRRGRRAGERRREVPRLRQRRLHLPEVADRGRKSRESRTVRGPRRRRHRDPRHGPPHRPRRRVDRAGRRAKPSTSPCSRPSRTTHLGEAEVIELLRAAARRRGRHEARPELQVRPARALQQRSRSQRSGLRQHGRRLPVQRPRARDGRARARRAGPPLHPHHRDHRREAAEEGGPAAAVDLRVPARPRHRLRRRGRRRHAEALQPAGEALRGERRAGPRPRHRDAAGPDPLRDGAGRHPRRPRPPRRAADPARQAGRRAEGGDGSGRRGSVAHARGRGAAEPRLAQAAGRPALRPPRLPRAEEDQDRLLHRRRGARQAEPGSPPTAPCRTCPPPPTACPPGCSSTGCSPSSPAPTSPSCRRPRSSSATAAFTAPSTRPAPPPAGSPAATRTCRTSRSARRRASRSAPPSSRPRA